MTEKVKHITFDQIKAGDHIKVTQTHKKGTIYTSDGVVKHVSTRGAWSEDDLTLVNAALPDSCINSVIELKNRPAMPFKVGTVIYAHLTNGTTGYFVRVDAADDDDILLWLELAGTGDNFISEGEIKQWTEQKLVAKEAKVTFE